MPIRRPGTSRTSAVALAQQVGGSTGTALLNTIAAGATAGYLASHDPGPAVRAPGLVHGYSVAAGWGTAILAAAALVAAILINAGRPAPRFAGQAAGGSSR